MIGDRRIDVDEIDLRVGEHVFVFRVALVDLEEIADLLELGGRALADGVYVGIRVALVNRDELGAEAEADDGDIDLLAHEVPFRVSCQCRREWVKGIIRTWLFTFSARRQASGVCVRRSAAGAKRERDWGHL